MALTKKSIKAKPVFETSWDDGLILDLVIAYYLERFEIKGTFYIVCDWVGKKGYLSWPQITMLDNRGHNIGSHNMSHPMDLKVLHDEALHVEIQSSKDIIENVLGHKITSFCYPRGRADERVRQAVAKAGYIDARTTGRLNVTEYKDELMKPGNWHVFQREEYGKRRWFDWGDYLSKAGAKYINLWGHANEVDDNESWDDLMVVLDKIKKAGWV